ncbi:MAG: CBS domain-containing protein [Desulfobacterales bacterium]|nr:CBS domain-containing protein [Desulfobacterales bacterium]
MISAKDVMSKRVATVSAEANIKEVIRLLVENKVTGLPVVSENGDLLGIVTEKDILRMLLYDRDVKEKTAADLMTTEIISFDENEDLMKIFKSLVEGEFRRVPILSEGKLAGIISRADIIKFLSKKTAA